MYLLYLVHTRAVFMLYVMRSMGLYLSVTFSMGNFEFVYACISYQYMYLVSTTVYSKCMHSFRKLIRLESCEMCSYVHRKEAMLSL